MKSEEQQKREAEQLMRNIDAALDLAFINHAMQGGAYGCATSTVQAAYAIHAARGGMCDSAYLSHAVVCHHELTQRIKQGQDLGRAVRESRMAEPGRSAFLACQDKTLSHLLDEKEAA